MTFGPCVQRGLRAGPAPRADRPGTPVLAYVQQHLDRRGPATQDSELGPPPGAPPSSGAATCRSHLVRNYHDRYSSNVQKYTVPHLSLTSLLVPPSAPRPFCPSHSVQEAPPVISCLPGQPDKMAEEKVYRASTTAPVNIAVVKYASPSTLSCLSGPLTLRRLCPGTGASAMPSSTCRPTRLSP